MKIKKIFLRIEAGEVMTMKILNIFQTQKGKLLNLELMEESESPSMVIFRMFYLSPDLHLTLVDLKLKN